jgi:hypothetical protein
MEPPQNELPAGWKSPFHPCSGNQNSTREFVVSPDFSVPVTRQKAGRSVNAVGAGAFPPAGAGGVNAPAATVLASAIVNPGNDVFARASHEGVDVDAVGRVLEPHAAASPPTNVIRATPRSVRPDVCPDVRPDARLDTRDRNVFVMYRISGGPPL